MRTFEHFLLTRMNTATAFSQSGAIFDPEWLDHRWSLFERYTIPSINAQVVAEPFQWLLFIHRDTPVNHRDRLEALIEGLDSVRILPCTTFDEHVAKEAVLERVRPMTTHIITSRVDNDDALGSSFLKTVQDQFDHQDGVFINFDLGFQISGRKVYRSEDVSNPYASAIEARGGFMGVFGVSHVDIAEHYPVYHVRDRGRWLTVIHSRNVHNRVDGTRCSSAELQLEFPWMGDEQFADRPHEILLDRVSTTILVATRRVGHAISKRVADRRSTV